MIENVKHWNNLLEIWLINNSNRQVSVDYLLNFSGFAIEDDLNDFDYALAKIPVDSLKDIHTVCGSTGFNDKIVKFLKSLKVEFIIALCDTNTGFIGCFVIELYSESALILEKIFEDENISMRYDSTNKEGWSFFENE